MISHKYYTSQQLANTNCSADMDDTSATTTPNRHKTKKKVGSYSFYYKHLIGSGYGGRVYRGVKDNQKNPEYAIKVINL